MSTVIVALLPRFTVSFGDSRPPQALETRALRKRPKVRIHPKCPWWLRSGQESYRRKIILRASEQIVDRIGVIDLMRSLQLISPGSCMRNS